MKQILPWLIASAVLAMLIAVGALVVFSIFGLWPIVLDITIVVTCVISLLMIGFLGAAVFYLAITLLRVKREMMPVLESLRETSQAVSDTARVATDLGVAPTVRTASALVGAAEAAALVFGRGQARTRQQRRQQRRQAVERELQARGELNGHRG